MDPYIAAAIGFVTAAALAMINTWLAGRAHTAEELRGQRIAAYPAVWRRTGIVSRWPRTDADTDHFVRLHLDLRRWYYGEGGMYLSTQARERYEHLQRVLEAILSQPESAVSYYEPVMEAASYFRTGLTRDLETRDRRSWLATIVAGREEAQARRKATSRLDAISQRRSATPRRPSVPTSPVVHRLTAEDERLNNDDEPPTTAT